MNQYRTLLPYLKPYWQGILWGILLALVLRILFSLLVIAALARIVNSLSEPTFRAYYRLPWPTGD